MSDKVLHVLGSSSKVKVSRSGPEAQNATRLPHAASPEKEADPSKARHGAGENEEEHTTS